MSKTVYRWVEPETVIVDEQGKQIAIPAHQEEGEYVGEANIPGYCIVLWNGKRHLIKGSDIVVIKS